MRRTKKQKEHANHSFTISWEPVNSTLGNKAVKSQSKNEKLGTSLKFRNSENAKRSDKESEFAHLRGEIVKTLVFASLILGVELVLYLASRTNV